MACRYIVFGDSLRRSLVKMRGRVRHIADSLSMKGLMHHCLRTERQRSSLRTCGCARRQMRQTGILDPPGTWKTISKSRTPSANRTRWSSATLHYALFQHLLRDPQSIDIPDRRYPPAAMSSILGGRRIGSLGGERASSLHFCPHPSLVVVD